MKKKYINITLVFLMLILTSVSCTKTWEEMNTDPNNPTDGPLTNLLANAIMEASLTFYDDWQGMNNFLSYSGHITKIAYIDETRYKFRPGVIEGAFRDYYRIQIDLQKAIEKAEASQNNHAKAAAITWSVYNWHQAVDLWGDIPYTEAITAESENNLTPVYDDAAAIYASLFTKIEEANTIFNMANIASNDIGTGDFIFGGDAALWQKFANSIHLRMAIRTQNTAELNKVMNAPATYPVFESNAEEAKLKWPGVSPYKEPWAENTDDRDDHGMAKTFIDMMLALDDPRIDVYAELNTSDDEYVGAPEGAENGSFNVNDISRPGTKYRNDYAGYSYFVRYSEVEFIKAEAYLLASNDADAQTAYEAGLAAVFAETGKTSDLAAYMAKAEVAWGDLTVYTNLEKIWLQKWIGCFKQGQELWAENRRTDFPVMDVASGSLFSGHNRQPFRYPYPNEEFTLNGANVEVAAAGIVDYYWGVQLFWDKRTGVQ